MTRAQSRWGCFLPDLTRLASDTSITNLPTVYIVRHSCKCNLEHRKIIVTKGSSAVQSQAFILARQLDADTLFVRRLGLCRVLLLNDARFVWLLLVPERNDIVELFDLSAQDRASLLDETNFAARLLKEHFAADKINFASLGNVVPQFHMHVIARHAQDAGWPGSPFGLPGRVPYAPDEAAEVIERLRGMEFAA